MLGITRNETIPSEPIKSALKSKFRKRPVSYPCGSTLEAIDAFADDIDRSIVYQSIEHLNRTGCFQLDRHKSKLECKIGKTIAVKSKTNDNRITADTTEILTTTTVDDINVKTKHNQQVIEKQKEHVNRTIDDIYHSNKLSNQASAATTTATGVVKRKTFYRWLYLSRKKQNQDRYESSIDDIHKKLSNRKTIVTRRRLSSSSSFKKSIKSNNKNINNKNSKIRKSRFFSCIPNCVANTTHRNDSIPNSLASSSLRFGKRGNNQKCNISNATKTISKKKFETSNDLTEHNFMLDSNSCSNCSNNNKSNSNNNTIFNHNSNNNCSLFNNLNIMDRSVDSIGSCSLDVDAESTDFSGIKQKNQNKKIQDSTECL